MPARITTLSIALTASLVTGTLTRPIADAPALDRRVVDLVLAGDAPSEAAHGFAGHETSTGARAGKPFRTTSGWMHYAMTTFDDTPVTVALTFLGVDTVARSFDVVVEDSVIASRVLAAPLDSTIVIELSVPFSITKGRSNIAIVLRARGGRTPALREVRTVQDHHEVSYSATR
ncbi:MAG TPA: DUF6805 domain-containing protein [Gemmatimonas sp.]|nr:DUF6805 domain-containing protein [Gemmatimonas sp.]